MNLGPINHMEPSFQVKGHIPIDATQSWALPIVVGKALCEFGWGRVLGPLSNPACPISPTLHPANIYMSRGRLGPEITGTLGSHLYFVGPAATKGVEQLGDPPRLFGDRAPASIPWKLPLATLGPCQP